LPDHSKLTNSDEDMPDVPEDDSIGVPIDKAPETGPIETEANVTSQGGRRRGRRKVMKKKTVKDEDGYLGKHLQISVLTPCISREAVTKEEAVWESFSEAEPEPKKPKAVPKAAPMAKGKKMGKQGQGSIASFFKKT
jgi:DNA polymerase delta subunit 3